MSRFKIRRKFRDAVDGVKNLAKVIHDESKFPGRPQPHMAAKNPMWGGEHSAPGDGDVKNQSSNSTVDASELQQPVERGSDGEEFWFLKDGDSEGWHETNPGLKGAEED